MMKIQFLNKNSSLCGDQEKLAKHKAAQSKPITFQPIDKQKGLVLVFALLVLLSITILGISSVSSSLLQGKMATSIERKSVSFDAAEAAIAGVVFESEDESVLVDAALTDPLSEARQQAAIDFENEDLSCFDDNRTNRVMTKNGLPFGHVFVVRGCGQTLGSNYVVANTLTAAVFAPASNQ
jgi:type IV pilus assembly protein PilX